ncbi:MAG: shikimate dehydrogenase [Spirochaetaceae bacterium]|nr:shikimate dehydrogenase [Spirochaetaceae bacterium]
MNEPNYKAELVGVFGHPVSENPTIVMQEAAFKEKGLNWRYLTIEVYPEDLEDAIKGLKAFNMRGINLTIPHKVEVLKYLDELSESAKIIGAVNTVVNNNKRLFGENTDGKGFLKALVDDGGVDPLDKNAVIFGAGGAARAIAVELIFAGLNKLIIINRTEERGLKLVNHLKDKTSMDVVFSKWDTPFSIPENFDIVVNATSIGLYPNINEKPDINYDSIKSSMVVCDVIPNPPRTKFLEEAGKRGAQTIDGLGMLVYQGAIGFKMWTGVDAPVNVMKEALKREFGA